MGCFHPKQDPNDEVTVVKLPDLSAEQWKEQGNSHFKSKQYGLAVKYYSQAIVFPTQALNPQVSIFYSNRARGLLCLREFEIAAKDAATALELDGSNVKAYLLYAQAKGYMAAQGEDTLVAEALEYCKTALTKCKEKQWNDGIEKSKLLRTKLLIVRYNADRKQQQAQQSALLAYYHNLDQDLSQALTRLFPVPETAAVPDYFTCLISLVFSI